VKDRVESVDEEETLSILALKYAIYYRWIHYLIFEFAMSDKPTYEELEQRVQELEKSE
jgi:hypothetical protein